MKEAILVRHIYENDSTRFESAVNAALKELTDEGATIDEIQYASDSALSDRHRAGYGALIIYEPRER